MSTSFEDQLKADLRAAADDAGLVGPDPDAVIGRGRRAVRRRRAMQVGSVAAVVAVVAVGSVLPWGGRQDALPAGWPSSLSFDDQGRPHDRSGAAGSIATVGGEDVWLSPDGMTLGSRQASTSTLDSRILEYGTEERSFVVVVLPPNAEDITLDATPGVPAPEVSVGRFAGPDGAEGTSVAVARFEGDHLDQWPLLQRARFTQDGFASFVELVGDGSQSPSSD